MLGRQSMAVIFYYLTVYILECEKLETEIKKSARRLTFIEASETEWDDYRESLDTKYQLGLECMKRSSDFSEFHIYKTIKDCLVI